VTAAAVTARRPLVGITCGLERARWNAWDTDAYVIHAQYAEMTIAAGGQPLLLPAESSLDATAVVERLDALVLAGGADVSPALYGEHAQPETDARPDRDQGELELLRAAERRGLPLLGICRGMQLMNVLRGGTLTQHLPAALGHDGHLRTTGVFGDHEVEIEPASRVAEIVGERIVSPSYHHQGIATLGVGLRAVGRAPDGTIEAVEDSRVDLFLGVQWHPEQERRTRPLLFEALVAAATRFHSR
jgi:gamma-glutamyl-gamma-aminobutyrate hydrolase PuuD